MKKLLYIPVNTKPEEMSTSKFVGRQFIKTFIRKYPEYEVEELDICNEYIPELNYRYLKKRGEIVSGSDYDALSEEDKKAVDRINQLCNQFISADVYIIAAPMWSSLFPARLKMYIDCIMQDNKVIKVTSEEVKGLLDDKERKMLYIQSSGGVYPRIMSWKIDHGVNYLHDIFKFVGIDKFEKLLVEGVDMPSVGKSEAVDRAFKEIDKMVDKMAIREMATR
ncbi:FMN-dependent NADH-azoreductase [Clostridium guangxiense]|uniref:FMN-dependent NADH-azoreductase n=1 Tax=Clostridium guangxiense TaxID=1662055 RepID=UPI001E387D04|nr:NAD(P)H-dependent oxidoreductase [Clostridium guangxiense]MCD2347631.1 NAD(P)H-dependent oxidoreductase [Clostridium guangxiense]